jgi:hypothetical protein
LSILTRPLFFFEMRSDTGERWWFWYSLLLFFEMSATFTLFFGVGIWVSRVSDGYQLGIKGFSCVSAHFEEWLVIS